MEEKRKEIRKNVSVIAVIRKTRADGTSALMEFRSKNLSLGGAFISTEDLTIFDLGEEVQLLISVDETKYYEGTARIVRSARIVEKDGRQIESGFGVMFLDPNESFLNAIDEKIQTDE